jgi:probable RNA-binding protein EIF1AD
MGKSRRNIQAAAQESITPPDELTATQSVARVIKAEGNSLYSCELPNKKTILLELEPKFRNTVFIKRGICPGRSRFGRGPQGELPGSGRDHQHRPGREIVAETGLLVGFTPLSRSISRGKRLANGSRPKEFTKNTYNDDSDSDDNTGKMPPSDSEEEEEHE